MIRTLTVLGRIGYNGVVDFCSTEPERVLMAVYLDIFAEWIDIGRQ